MMDVLEEESLKLTMMSLIEKYSLAKDIFSCLS
jgi:hypothetical protein